MDRRKFLTTIGLSAAAVSVAPKILAEPLTYTTDWIVPEPTVCRLVSILPCDIAIPESAFKFHEYLQERMQNELGLKDLEAFHKTKRNHHGQRTAR